MEDVDLGVCRGRLFPGKGDHAALLLPGARYVPAAPLLWFAREVLQARGWTVLQVWDEWDRSDDAIQWVTDRFEAGLRHLADYPTPLVVAKSLTTLALPLAVERRFRGIWITPLLAQEVVRSALADTSEPSLIVGGTGDPTWDSQFAAGLEIVEVFEIADADHGLQHPGDPLSSVDVLKTVIDRVGQFVDHLV